MINQLVIMSGGKGTRIKKYFKGPKILINIFNKPLLYWHIKNAEKYKIKKILIITGYKSAEIEQYISKIKTNIKIIFFKEKILNGTGGALIKVKKFLDNEFFLIYGDVIQNINLKRFYKFHTKKKSDVTIFTHPNDHPESSDLVVADQNNRVVKIMKYPHKTKIYGNLAISAAFCIKKKNLNKMNVLKKTKIDFAKDILTKRLNLKIYSYQSIDLIKDCGNINRVKEINKNKNLFNKLKDFNNKNKCIFLDMDGTIVEEVKRLNSYKKLKYYPQVGNIIKEINKSNFLAVLITNKPIIAKGFCSEDMLIKIFNSLEAHLALSGSFLDRIYYCPHHPNKGFKGEVKSLKINCVCRKPKIGLLKKACREMNISYKKSWIIGDSTIDIQLAKNAKMKSILVKTGYKGRDKKFNVNPDFKFNNLKSAVKFILNNSKKD